VVLDKPKMGGKVQFLKLYSFHLELWEFENPKENNLLQGLKTLGIRHLAFEVEDIHKTIEELKSLEFTEPKQGTSCKWYSFTKDPNGISLELYEK
jgi:glyoxylase I family protein